MCLLPMIRSTNAKYQLLNWGSFRRGHANDGREKCVFDRLWATSLPRKAPRKIGWKELQSDVTPCPSWENGGSWACARKQAGRANPAGCRGHLWSGAAADPRPGPGSGRRPSGHHQAALGGKSRRGGGKHGGMSAEASANYFNFLKSL